jgi:hypothetical protein
LIVLVVDQGRGFDKNRTAENRSQNSGGLFTSKSINPTKNLKHNLLQLSGNKTSTF